MPPSSRSPKNSVGHNQPQPTIRVNKPIVLVQYEKIMLSTPNKKIIFFKFIFFLGGRPRIQERTGQEKERKARKDDQEE